MGWSSNINQAEMPQTVVILLVMAAETVSY